MCVIYPSVRLHNNTILQFCTIIYRPIYIHTHTHIYIYIYLFPQTKYISSFIFLPSFFIFSLLPVVSLFHLVYNFVTSSLSYCVSIFYSLLLPFFLSLLSLTLPSFLPHTALLYWRYQLSHYENKHILSQFFFRWMQHYRVASSPAKHWNQQTRYC
jgi:hypothetical protein